MHNYQQEDEKSSFRLSLSLCIIFSPGSIVLLASILAFSFTFPHPTFSVGSGPCRWRDGVTQAGHVGRRPLSSTCLVYKAYLPPSHQSSPLPSSPPLHGHWEKCRHITLQCFSSLCDSVSTPLPVTSTPYILMFGVLGCAPLQNPAMWHLDNFTLCILCWFPTTHIYSYAEPILKTGHGTRVR